MLYLFLSAQVPRIESAPEGILETGVPPFTVLGLEAMGLSELPTDLQPLSDGRLLLLASGQIYVGDGTRWDGFRRAPENEFPPPTGVVVDQDDQIYTAVPGGFARIELGEDKAWRFARGPTRTATGAPLRTPRRKVTAINGEWFWINEDGSVSRWRAGQVTQLTGPARKVEHVFGLLGKVYLSDRADGELFRLQNDQLEPVPLGLVLSVEHTVTCAQPYDRSTVLVGTARQGLYLFDGYKLRPFLPSGPLTGGFPITDLCRTEGNGYAVAVENLGIVFLDHEGRVLQVLDRGIDHRLSFVHKLQPSAGGVIWGLLDEGVLRVEFPSRVSYFPSIPSAGSFSPHPSRYHGGLWIMSYHNISRAIYNEEGRLAQFVDDYPSGHFVFSFSTAPGLPVAGATLGAFYRSESGWVNFAPDVENFRILDPAARNGRWLYGAKGEVGWVYPKNGAMVIERLPLPALPTVYASLTDDRGMTWLELGVGQIGRLHFEGDRPVLELFDRQNGVPHSWTQVFLLNGVAGFNLADQVYRFAEADRQFVLDTDFTRRYPGLRTIIGRPGIDARGRLWVNTRDGVQVLENRQGLWQNIHERIPPRLQPLYFTFEDKGVVWMHCGETLVRFDPSMPAVPAEPLRALISHVELTGTNRTLFPAGAVLQPIDFSDNSISAQFMALGNPFTDPVTFEVMLEGAGGVWNPVNGNGLAVFNRLKDGAYLLRVRPRAGELVGTEATLAFSIRPPWFRSATAYLVYAVAVIILVLLAAWLIAYLQRRETARLARLVAQRTQELSETANRLASQVDEIQMLSQAIAQSPVGVLITRPDGTIVFANPRICELTGYTTEELPGQNLRLLHSEETLPDFRDVMATVEQGESWHGQLERRHRDGRGFQVRATVAPIRNSHGQIRLHLFLEEDITDWLAEQERRQKLETQLLQSQKLESLGTLAGGIAHDFNNILTGILGFCELARLTAPPHSDLEEQLQEIRLAGLRAKELVAQILTFSRRTITALTPLDLSLPVAEAIKLIRASTPATVEMVSRLESGTVRCDGTQIQQVVLNLCTNAVHAMREKPGRLTVTLQPTRIDLASLPEMRESAATFAMRLLVSDTGCGIDPAALSRIFDPFFTTKRPGEGTGLGLAIVQGIVATHHGAIRVHSTPGVGTTFELYFPLCADGPALPALSNHVPHGSQEEILVVDDESTVVEFASTRLRQFGYRVTGFTDPHLALRAIRSAPDRFKALVTDLTMPHLTGLQLLEEARKVSHGLPAVIISGYGQGIDGQPIELKPDSQLLAKPFDGEDLAAALHDVLQKPAKPSG